MGSDIGDLRPRGDTELGEAFLSLYSSLRTCVLEHEWS